ncbi:amino acid adenylation domain-containing protein [Streptomyces sp. NPDC007971]|uniref:non-ribosomal peptide synthetase n=1 Tax=Streptomyces sp. NPDC007971 TaxID=3364799 RepID=UPI0036E57BA5
MPRLDRTADDGASALSAAQQRQWIADRAVTEPPDHVVLRWRVRGSLDTTALRAALTALLERHPALRTRLSPDGAVPQPTISADPSSELAFVGATDATGRPDAVAAETVRPFDLSAGPLVRAVVSESADVTALTLVVPRIVCDPHSAGVLQTDLADLYRAALTGSPAPREPAGRLPARRYAPEELDAQRAFWRDRLADLPPFVDLPADRPRPAVHTQRTRTVLFDVPLRLVHRPGDTEPSRTAAFTAFGAALAALLIRYSRSGDIVFATQTPGAREPGADGVVGCLAPLLPLRIDGRGDPSFRTLTEMVREAARTAVAHSAVPFQHLVADLATDREPSRHPIAQVVLDVRPYAQPDAAQPDAVQSGAVQPHAAQPDAAQPDAVQPHAAQSDAAQAHAAQPDPDRGLWPELAASARSPFDLTVTVARAGDAYHVGFAGTADLFSADALERAAGHFRRLLTDGLTHGDRPLSRLTMIGRDERHLVVEAGNRPEPVPGATILDLFSEQVSARGDATALWSPPHHSSYGELDCLAEELADHLVRLGIRPDDRVAVLLPRAPQQVVALLAILKAGGAYVPLDPAHPPERLDFVLRDSAARLVLTDGELSGRLPGAVQRLHVDAPLPVPAAQRPSRRPGVAPDNLAYLIYTSGSTGVPKGVAVTHRCVVRLVRGLDRIGLCPSDTLLMLAPTAFDASTFEVWGALCNGARLAVHPPGQVGPRELAVELERLGVTVLWLTAQLANMVADVQPEALRPLRTLVVGGEALSVPHLRALLDAHPGLSVVNGYGPTETTTFATTYPVVADQLDEAAGVPIGHPIGGTRCYIVDGAGRPAPVGVLGELLVGGAGVARGYLGRPGLTAERFVPDPFGPPGGRLYRTGDLARRRADGAIEFAGRIDDQVKLRGFRIEPGEVRTVLAGHPAVRDAFVAVRGTGLAAGLVAYVVPHAEGDTPDAALRAYLRERLPEPLIPGRFVFLDRLPLTVNGKVDRRALPDPLPGRPGAGRLRAPASPWEKAVADVWASVLGRSPGAADEDFFALGGTSLDLLKVAAELAEGHGTVVPLRTLFRLRTVAELAAALEAGAVSASDRR